MLRPQAIKLYTIICLIGFFSMGFWGQKKTEVKKPDVKQSKMTPQAVKKDAQQASSKTTTSKNENALNKKTAPAINIDQKLSAKKSSKEMKITPAKETTAKKASPGKPIAKKQDTTTATAPDDAAPTNKDENIEQIQNELKEIVNRTEQIQKTSRSERSDIQSILDKARIHEQILRNMAVPKPVTVNQTINVDDIARREKLRIISTETLNIEKRLKAIETAKNVERTSRIAKMSGLVSGGGSAQSVKIDNKTQSETVSEINQTLPAESEIPQDDQPTTKKV